MYCIQVVDMEGKGSFSGCRGQTKKMDGWMEKMDGWMDGEDGWIERGEASGWNRREASKQEVKLHLENMQYQTQVPATRTLRYTNFSIQKPQRVQFFVTKMGTFIKLHAVLQYTESCNGDLQVKSFVGKKQCA